LSSADLLWALKAEHSKEGRHQAGQQTFHLHALAQQHQQCAAAWHALPALVCNLILICTPLCSMQLLSAVLRFACLCQSIEQGNAVWNSLLVIRTRLAFFEGRLSLLLLMLFLSWGYAASSAQVLACLTEGLKGCKECVPE